ncbi:MAG: O-antigen ligase family protein [Coriobacteriia bacterium]|nr:O-antigen ligase family protein [Coriobacteriia bacterium]
MARAKSPTQGHGRLRDAVPVALVLIAFTSSGAWLVSTLPPPPISKALNLATVGLWLIAAALGLMRIERPDRRLLIGLAAVAGSVLVSLLAGGSIFATIFYDLFGDMPLIQWLAFPVMFVLALGFGATRERVEDALSAVVALGALLSISIGYQQLTTAGGNSVFGSTAYSVVALAALIPIAIGLTDSGPQWRRLAAYACAGSLAVGVGVVSRSTMGSLAVVFALVVSVLVHPLVFGSSAPSRAWIRSAALVVAGLMVAGLTIAQIPSLGGRWVNPEAFAAQKNLVTRVYLWQGAEKMLAERPVVGFGPSGYRVHAVDYLAPEALLYGPDQAGNSDPTVYSPQSPHSILWEVATRLGVVGLLAFAILFGAWLLVVRDRVQVRDGTGALRMALAAGFVSSLFALLVNPVVFPLGLFLPVAAGLAAGTIATSGQPARSVDRTDAPSRTAQWALGVSGAAVIVLSVWLFAGEWKAFTLRFEEPRVANVGYEAALRITPGHPLTMRRLLENRLLIATDAGIAAAQGNVDTAPGFIREFTPNLANFAAYSLTQAQLTGRKDLSWEREMLTRTASSLPFLPSTVSEQLHLAVLSGDADAIRAALPPVRQWGMSYPYAEQYIAAAEAVVGTQP